MSRRQRSVSRTKKSSSRGWGPLFVRLFGGIGVIVLLLAAIGYFSIRSYLRSEAFRVVVSEKISEAVGIEGEIAPMQWRSESIESEAFLGKGSGVLRSLEADKLEVGVDYDSLWTDTLEFGELRIASLDLKSGFSQIQELKPKISSRNESGVTEVKAESWYQKYFPRKAQLSELDVGQLHYEHTLENGAKYSVENTRARLEISSQGIHGELEGGDIELSNDWVKSARLDATKLSYRKKVMYVHSLEAGIFDSADFRMNGEKHFDSSGKYSFQGTLMGADCHEFLSTEWDQKLEGEMAIKFLTEGGKNKERKTSGEIKIRNGSLTALPVLEKIAAYADSSQFRRLRFSKFQCKYFYSASSLELSDIFLHCDGLMRIEGSLAIRNRQLDGVFQVGITPGVLSHIPGAESKIFLKGKDQLLWTSVRISGTVDNMEEDLSNRMLIAAGMRMFEVIPETGAQVLKYTGETIESMALPDGFEAVPKAVIDLGSGLLKGDPSQVIDNGLEVIEESAGVLETGADLLGGLGGLLGGESQKKEKEGDQTNGK